MRVVGNNLLVQLVPEKKVSDGGIVIPDNVLGGLLRIGKVLDVGYLTGSKIQDRVPVPGLQRGDHVVFVRFHEVVASNVQIQKTMGRDVVCLRPADVLLVIDAEDMKRVG